MIIRIHVFKSKTKNKTDSNSAIDPKDHLKLYVLK